MKKSKLIIVITSLLLFLFQSPVYAHLGEMHEDEALIKVSSEPEGDPVIFYVGELLSNKLITKSEILSVISSLKTLELTKQEINKLLDIEGSFKEANWYYINKNSTEFRNFAFSFAHMSVELGGDQSNISLDNQINLMERTLKQQTYVTEIIYNDLIDRVNSVYHDVGFVVNNEIDNKYNILLAEKEKLGELLLTPEIIDNILPNCDITLFYNSYKHDFLQKEIESIENKFVKYSRIHSINEKYKNTYRNFYKLTEAAKTFVVSLENKNELTNEDYLSLSEIRNVIAHQETLTEELATLITNIANLYYKHGKKPEGNQSLMLLITLDTGKLGTEKLESALRENGITDKFIIVNGTLLSTSNFISLGTATSGLAIPLREISYFLGHKITITEDNKASLWEGKELLDLSNLKHADNFLQVLGVTYVSISKIGNLEDLKISAYSKGNVLSLTFE